MGRRKLGDTPQVPANKRKKLLPPKSLGNEQQGDSSCGDSDWLTESNLSSTATGSLPEAAAGLSIVVSEDSEQATSSLPNFTPRPPTPPRGRRSLANRSRLENASVLSSDASVEDLRNSSTPAHRICNLLVSESNLLEVPKSAAIARERTPESRSVDLNEPPGAPVKQKPTKLRALPLGSRARANEEYLSTDDVCVSSPAAEIGGDGDVGESFSLPLATSTPTKLLLPGQSPLDGGSEKSAHSGAKASLIKELFRRIENSTGRRSSKSSRLTGVRTTSDMSEENTMNEGSCRLSAADNESTTEDYIQGMGNLAVSQAPAASPIDSTEADTEAISQQAGKKTPSMQGTSGAPPEIPEENAINAKKAPKRKSDSEQTRQAFRSDSMSRESVASIVFGGQYRPDLEPSGPGTSEKRGAVAKRRRSSANSSNSRSLQDDIDYPEFPAARKGTYKKIGSECGFEFLVPAMAPMLPMRTDPEPESEYPEEIPECPISRMARQLCEQAARVPPDGGQPE